MNWTNERNGDLPASGYLTKAWVLDRYQISNSTLHSWIGSNKFPRGVRIGPRAVRFLASDLAAFEARILAEHGTRAGDDR